MTQMQMPEARSLEAELHTRGHRRCFVDFDELLGDWRGTLARVAHQLAITWPTAADDAAAAIDVFLDPRQRHHVAAPCDDEAAPAIAP